MSDVTTTKKRLRWRLAGRDIGSGLMRGYDLMYGDDIVARARQSQYGRFYFYASGGRNSQLAGENFATMDETKTAAMAFIRDEIAQGRPL